MAGKAGKPVLAQVNKLKRQERLEEIDELLRENKTQQDELSRKLEDARSLDGSDEVSIKINIYYGIHYFFRFDLCANSLLRQ